MRVTSSSPSALGEMVACEKLASTSGGPPGCMTTQAPAKTTPARTRAARDVRTTERGTGRLYQKGKGVTMWGTLQLGGEANLYGVEGLTTDDGRQTFGTRRATKGDLGLAAVSPGPPTSEADGAQRAALGSTRCQSLDNRTITIYAQNMFAFAQHLTACLCAGCAVTAAPAHPSARSRSIFSISCAPRCLFHLPVSCFIG